MGLVDKTRRSAGVVSTAVCAVLGLSVETVSCASAKRSVGEKDGERELVGHLDLWAWEQLRKMLKKTKKSRDVGSFLVATVLATDPLSVASPSSACELAPQSD